MKKALILILILVLSGFSGLMAFNILQIVVGTQSQPVYGSQPFISQEKEVPLNTASPNITSQGAYEIYVDGELSNRFATYEEALAFGSEQERAALRKQGKFRWLWDNYPPYLVFLDSSTHREFETFAEAVQYAKQQPSYIYYRKDSALIWTNIEERKAESKIPAVPWIGQLPELPRGCEVTSLAMLMNYKGIKADKLILADKIQKNQTQYRREKGKIYSGSPYNGFVGDMNDAQKHGLGVYHGPIHALLTTYLPNSSLDLTGVEFEDLFYFIQHNTPVWVIINTKYQKLPESSFETWHTEDGELKITYSEHSVLVTGYDEDYIYFNDPLSETTSKASRSGFIAAWVQMGRQAVTVTL